MKTEILSKLNELIVDEKGIPVNMSSLFTDSELDSLGTVLTIVQLECDYPFFQGIEDDADAFASLDIPNLTVRELIRKCVLSITPTSKEPNPEMAT